MLTDTVTISVDTANTGTPTSESFTRYEEFQNRSTYIGADHTPDVRNVLGFYRTFPTKNGNFKGTSKSAVKFTQDVQVAGADGVSTLTAPIILDLSFSVPVGASTADLVHARQRLLALLDGDTLMNSLNVQLQI